nr:MAG TPA: Phosphoribulokinase / Uridine kinase family [Caudoviricetes sp.]
MYWSDQWLRVVLFIDLSLDLLYNRRIQRGKARRG